MSVRLPALPSVHTVLSPHTHTARRARTLLWVALFYFHAFAHSFYLIFSTRSLALLYLDRLGWISHYRLLARFAPPPLPLAPPLPTVHVDAEKKDVYTTLEVKMVDETSWSTNATKRIVQKQIENGMSSDMMTRTFTEQTKDDSRVRCKLHLVAYA